MKGLKLALVHEWLINIAGSEKVSAEIYRLFKPDVFTLLMKEEVARELFPEAKVTPSFLQRFPKAHSFHRFLLPLFPLAVEQFNLSEYNVIISSSHAVAKGVLTRGDQLHICYCHTPMRYAWDLYHQYTNSLKGFKKLFSTLILHYIRIWDSLTANRVDHFIANSKFVARRIKRVYGKEAKVIYPPVEVDKFSVSERREDYYITVSRFVPYKRVDVVIEAFKQLKGRRLVVVGDGPQFKELKKLAGRNVEFTGKVNFQRLKELLQKAKAFIFAAEE
ncbi:glycosyltransferase, partial [Thermovibrio ammonificans]